MLDLDPAKLLVILVVGLVVLGPERLPQLARQAGSLWADVRRLRKRLEDEVRSNFPDLPSTHELTRAVRSPVSLLDRLADAHEAAPAKGGTGSLVPPPGAGSEAAASEVAGVSEAPSASGASAVRARASEGGEGAALPVFAEPSMN